MTTWYALNVVTGRELSIAEDIRDLSVMMGETVLVPIERVTRRSRRGLKTSPRPLVSGYIFVTDPWVNEPMMDHDRTKKLSRGVIGVVMLNGRPAPISNQSMAAIMALDGRDSPDSYRPPREVGIGDVMRIAHGAMTGQCVTIATKRSGRIEVVGRLFGAERRMWVSPTALEAA